MANGPRRHERYNAKARQSSVGGSSHKGKKSLRERASIEADANAQVMDDATRTALAEQDRQRRALLREGGNDDTMKLSTKKKRRLDKFIEAKLRKEEKARILQKLAKSSAEITDRTELVSAATLGTGRIAKESERVQKLLESQEQGHKRKRAAAFQIDEDEEDADLDAIDDESDHESEQELDREHISADQDERQQRILEAVKKFEQKESSPLSAKPNDVGSALVPPKVGSALATGADGKPVMPVMRKRQRQGKVQDRSNLSIMERVLRGKHEKAPANDTDSSFDSDESSDEAQSEVDAPDGAVVYDVDKALAAKKAQAPVYDSDSVDTEDLESEEPDTDADEEAVLLEAMRRRGLLPEDADAIPEDFALQLARPKKGEDNNGHVLEPVGGRVDRVRDLGPQDGKIRGPLGREAAVIKSPFTQKYLEEETVFQAMGDSAPLRHVQVKRPSEMQEARMKLPVVAEEDEILRKILENPVTVLCGETGSGKTTQVPQFLYEAGFGTAGSANPGMIGITQPRRVAAVSMARRVAEELQVPENRVSYQIRYDATTSPHTQLKFMTDGVLLRELAQDLTLSKYSVIIVDEAHERSVNTDVLIGMLSRVVRMRAKRWMESKADGLNAPRPLRLVIMSATMRVGDFTQNTVLFSTPPPVVQIDVRQHPVTIHFNRRTVQDYVTEAIKKTSKIHTRLPPGGILIFVTGQQEVQTVCRKLQQRYGPRALAAKAEAASYEAVSARIANVEAEEMDLGTADAPRVDDVDEDRTVLEDEEALDTDDEEEEEAEALHLPPSDEPMHILPMYSLLPAHEQQRVFEPPPEGSRLVVVATNVAETSITIPHIKYVVDAGRAKERRIDPRSQVQSYDIAWISKASASQRAGRAGRTGPGHCYRLYSSAVYEEHFVEFGVPEILRTPVDGLVLQMKAMNIDQVAHFPFPTPPDREALARAERMLLHLGALENVDVRTQGTRAQHASITSLGRVMALFPVAPRYAKLLAQGHQHSCLPYAVALVAAMSVGDIFEREDMLTAQAAMEIDADADPAATKEARRTARAAYFRALRVFDAIGEGLSDAFRLLSVVGAYSHDAARGVSVSFCREHFVRVKAMEEIHKLRAQLSNLVLANLTGLSDMDATQLRDPSLPPPNTTQCKVLRQLLTAIYIDRVAVRADLVDAPEAALAPARAGSKMASTRRVPYVALGVPGAAYIHVSSSFYHRPPPEWIVFGEVHQSAPKHAVIGDEELEGGESAAPPTQWLKMVTKINPAWLPTLGRTLCTFSQPSDAPDATALASSMQALKRGGTLPAVERTVLLTPRYGGAMQDGAAGGGLGWELPPIQAKQVLVNGRWTTKM
ncbi:p-loop containing nucleoside triphosphate hydrolase protein [Malassezia pachydermatis]|uniref:RNA helicase n=1 Tax=Malassezia pachydermatis TaxID=77020 RepID=A0A0M8MXS7_9BASI|nr:p-loop containing nucleoside triphosphate hydrolase protein [Malassezia pachydermatis]KOS15711.1 p-loop containing nucleoside triphosphate hydrolase protein [Malassezia pachydermatis]